MIPVAASSAKAIASANRERRRRRSVAGALIIVIVASLTYINTLNLPLIYEDIYAIVSNPSLREVWPPLTALQPPLETVVSGHPLVNLSFAANTYLDGVRVAGYHLVNLALHICAALLLFGLLKRLLPRMDIPAWNPETSRRIALICTLVWMLHPLHSETVNYVSDRVTLMAGVAFLLVVYASVRAWTEHKGPWTAVAFVAAVAGAASGEAMLTVPLVVLLADRTFAYPSLREALRARAPLYALLATSWAVFAYLAPQMAWFNSGSTPPVPFGRYLLNQAPMLVAYVRRSVWPTGLVFDYGPPEPLVLGDVWMGAVLIVFAILLTLVVMVRQPKAGFWGVWFFLTLAPTSLLPDPLVAGAEHRMYLPLISLVMGAVLLGQYISRLVSDRTAGAASTPLAVSIGRWISPGITFAVLLVLAAATIDRSNDYQSGIQLWETVLDRRPHARAHAFLGDEFRRAGRMEEAITHLSIASAGWPEARVPLGALLRARGDVDGAVAQLQSFTDLKPRSRFSVIAHEQLAAARIARGEKDLAKAEYRKLLTIEPNLARSHVNLADLLFADGDAEGAVTQYREFLRLQPDDVVGWTRLGSALAAAGQVDDGIKAFRRALEISPRESTARRELIRLLLKAQQFPEAEQESRTLLTQQPNDPDARAWLDSAASGQNPGQSGRNPGQ